VKYTARSASDKTNDWPFWFVADDRGLNVTVKLVPDLRGTMPFLPRSFAEAVATKANEAGAVQ